MALSFHALNSRVARRIVSYFLFAALTPLIILSLITNFQMDEELQKQSENYMHQDAKLLGLSIYNRLRLLKDELQLNTHKTLELFKTTDENNKNRVVDSTLVESFFLLKSTGEIISNSNSVIPHHGDQLFEQIYNNKILGKPLLLSFSSKIKNEIPYLYLIVPVDSSSTRSDFIGAQLNTANILGIEMIENRDDLVCILSESGLPLYCNKPAKTSWIASVADKQRTTNSGFYLWQGDGHHYTAYWSLFLDAHYQVEKWTVVIANSENPAKDAMERFQSVLLTVVSIIGFLVILLSLPIIRSRVLPLERILSATRNLADGKFNAKIEINSGDEFQEIGDAINSMTDKLGQQFEYQSILSIIGPQMLKADNARTVFRIIHHQLNHLQLVIGIGVINLDRENIEPEAFTYPISETFPTNFNKPILFRESSDLPAHIWYGVGKDMLAKYQTLDILKPSLEDTYLLMPVKMDESIIALIAIELKSRDKSIDMLLEQIGDITSNALSNIILSREIKFQANHDSLTNLPNRYLFQDRLNHAIHKAERDNKIFAILFFDLDRFKQINDSLGHTLGDQVLKLVAQRLKKHIRLEDTIARIGGDEFTIIAESLTSPEGAAVLAEKLKTILENPYYCGGHELYVTGSIGISLYPQDGHDADTLVRNADAAMYRAKEDGINSYHFYSPELTERAFERVLMEKNLRNAIRKNEFQLYYQPQFQLKSLKMIGLEALIRWPHPTLGFIPPNTFIPIAEETGLINEIGQWVLEEACAQIFKWHTNGEFSGRVAVNVSIKQLSQPGFIDTVKSVLDATNCKPSWLEIEITEGYLMSDQKSSIQKLKQLQSMGIEIAIDDFGTGYSSLSYLKKLPISKLKIDKSFVDELPNNSDDVAITKAIIALGKSLGLKLIAEGVETSTQKDFLEAEGCDEVQGYLYSKPLSVEKLQLYWSKNKVHG